MNIILLSGGSGKRLWPLSNDVRSKQFIPFFENENGDYESMVQRIYHQIKQVDSSAKITIATSESQVPLLRNQLGDEIGISPEPFRRDTFPAIVLAAAYLQDIKGVSKEESVVVCPVDPYVEVSYFEAIRELAEMAQDEKYNLSLMGIEPESPSDKFGYIMPVSKDKISSVNGFKEKPDIETAAEYISQGALWNGGIFAFQLGYLMKKAHEMISFTDYQDLYDKYEELEKISFDYAVVEKEEKIQVLRFAGVWKDLGTWNSLAEVMNSPVVGNAKLEAGCENVHVINELDVPILCIGLKDMVVSASAEGILVSDIEKSTGIKSYVEQMEQKIMYAEKSWGSFRVMDIEEDSMTIKVTLNAGHSMNYHSHQYRDEVWTILSGTGKTIVDGMEQTVHPGDVITMEAGCRHTIIAETELKIMEVQLGKEISVNDKRIYEL